MSFKSLFFTLLLFFPCLTCAYGEGYYQSYYESYYQSYYQTYYQTYYQSGYGVILTQSATIQGNASVVGALSKGSGSFLIDHPLDPKNSLLVFSFVESPDVKNVYDGIVTLDENGTASVELPSYFFALNTEYRYLATAIGSPMRDLHIAKEVGYKYVVFGPARFVIAGGEPFGEVSWQVTGIRHDRLIRAHPIVPEVPKEGSGVVDPGECLFEPLCQ